VGLAGRFESEHLMRAFIVTDCNISLTFCVLAEGGRR